MKKEVIKEKSFNNRLLYTFILLGIVFSLTLGVNAFGTSTPSTFGHSVGELDFTGGFNVPSGNVGIGTTSPGAKLDVNGNILSNSLRLPSGTDLNTLTRWSINDVQNPNKGVSGQSWHNLMTIPSADTNYITQLNFGMTENYPNLWIRTKAAGTWGSWYQIARNQMPQDFSFMGNVGIGTTSPSSKLEIYDGYLTINSPGLGWGTNQRIVSKGPLSFMPDSDNTKDSFIYMLNPSASSTITFNTVTGDVTANAFIYSSDKRLKENIKPLTNSLDKINQLEGVSFNWKDTGIPSIGLIAQDVEKVVPEIVNTNSEGFKGVEYGNLVALLIQGIKEQQKEIDNLQKQIDELKARER